MRTRTSVGGEYRDIDKILQHADLCRHPNIEARPTKRRRIEPSPFQWRHDRHYTPPVHSARNKDRLRKIRCHNARIDQLERAGGRNKEELKAMKDNLGLMREAIMQKDGKFLTEPTQTAADILQRRIGGLPCHAQPSTNRMAVQAVADGPTFARTATILTTRYKNVNKRGTTGSSPNRTICSPVPPSTPRADAIDSAHEGTFARHADLRITGSKTV